MRTIPISERLSQGLQLFSVYMVESFTFIFLFTVLGLDCWQ